MGGRKKTKVERAAARTEQGRAGTSPAKVMARLNDEPGHIVMETLHQLAHLQGMQPAEYVRQAILGFIGAACPPEQLAGLVKRAHRAVQIAQEVHAEQMRRARELEVEREQESHFRRGAGPWRPTGRP